MLHKYGYLLDYVDEGGEAFLGGLARLEQTDRTFGITGLRPLAALHVTELRRRVINHLAMSPATMKSLTDLTEQLVHEQGCHGTGRLAAHN